MENVDSRLQLCLAKPVVATIEQVFHVIHAFSLFFVVLKTDGVDIPTPGFPNAAQTRASMRRRPLVNLLLVMDGRSVFLMPGGRSEKGQWSLEGSGVVML